MEIDAGGRKRYRISERSVKVLAASKGVVATDVSRRLGDIERTVSAVLGDDRLRQTIRTQSQVIAHMSEVIKHQEAAARSLEDAHRHQALASEALNVVTTLQSELIAVDGVPDLVRFDT